MASTSRSRGVFEYSAVEEIKMTFGREMFIAPVIIHSD